ncbi:hypothetical protein I79_012004 [Cricetulus griseus]|uniref:Uncharacterized protein n=1 Tax=Cricetulus griseus TaxID=10029 RepID=G3HMN5_CRIGR|nr:hypothetical protein I79_012004 [Cricetulus griseus]
MNTTKVKSASCQDTWRCGHGPSVLRGQGYSIKKVIYVLDISENTGSKSLKVNTATAK